ncbi:MAG: transcriptional regulator, TetR family, partial [Conexibacter sp.]|nr:transcriptional regulator, TetR family [Conexibacter sp.]
MTARWAGSTLEDRAAARRAALLEAGVELLGTEGAAGVTVRAACRATKLSERYFYESFDGRDALLRAVHAQV